MVKKVDSQKTKDDSNEFDQKAAEVRRNAQLLKAQKRKKVRFLSLTHVFRTDKTGNSHDKSNLNSKRKLFEPNFNKASRLSKNLYKLFLRNKLSLSTKMFRWRTCSPTLATTWSSNRFSKGLTRMKPALQSKKISR